MNPQKHTMTVLAQIASWIPDKRAENLARKHKNQMRSFSRPFGAIACHRYCGSNTIFHHFHGGRSPLSRLRYTHV